MERQTRARTLYSTPDRERHGLSAISKSENFEQSPAPGPDAKIGASDLKDRVVLSALHFHGGHPVFGDARIEGKIRDAPAF